MLGLFLTALIPSFRTLFSHVHAVVHLSISISTMYQPYLCLSVLILPMPILTPVEQRRLWNGPLDYLHENPEQLLSRRTAVVPLCFAKTVPIHLIYFPQPSTGSSVSTGRCEGNGISPLAISAIYDCQLQLNACHSYLKAMILETAS